MAPGSNKRRKVKVDAPLPPDKIRMRTAREVINRVAWDPTLPDELFVVGYLDRFAGIMERCITAFNFRDDLATLSHLELAIPTHRVQYIKYKTTIVWDKRDDSRCDNFYASYPEKAVSIEQMMAADPPPPPGV